MFDECPTEARFDLLERIRRFFLYHGHDLEMAMTLLGGAVATRRLASCAARLEGAPRIDQRIQRELAAIHRLLSLDDVGHPDNIETALFADLHPDSAEVEIICRLTDLLGDLLRELEDTADRPSGGPQTGNSLAA